MKIVFFSNYLNHHQYPLCMEFVNNPNIEFYFVATQKLEDERISLGYRDMNQESFVIRTYEDPKAEEVAIKLCEESDIMILGLASKKYMEARVRSKKILFLYTERIFKKGIRYSFSPRTILYMLRRHYKYNNKNVFLLCASAFATWDYNKMGAYRNKTYKWGYFPKTYRYDDLKKIINAKRKNSIIWVGRFVKWKHPEQMIELARFLNKDGIDFQIKMIGNGDKYQEIDRIIKEENLDNKIQLLGAMSPEEVRKQMEDSEIFVFSSDYNEGWGAVLNEAMNSMCAVVVSHAIGAAPFLVENMHNGIIYENENIKELYKHVRFLLDNKEVREKIQINAYETIVGEWNSKEAANRLIMLFEHLESGHIFDIYESGPCSKAVIIKNNWY